ncbi:MAG: hypothetical protein ABSB59_35220, partial [Streptosporangiaceae bacterium]
HITAVRRLSGGCIADAWLIAYADGTTAVGKIITAAPPDVFRVEASGLAALRSTGYLALTTLEHLHYGSDYPFTPEFVVEMGAQALANAGWRQTSPTSRGVPPRSMTRRTGYG